MNNFFSEISYTSPLGNLYLPSFSKHSEYRSVVLGQQHNKKAHNTCGKEKVQLKKKKVHLQKVKAELEVQSCEKNCFVVLVLKGEIRFKN